MIVKTGGAMILKNLAPEWGHVSEKSQRIRHHQPGEVVVVVGHSNSVPPIVNVLTGRSLPDLALDQYDRVYVVTVRGDEHGSLVTFRYGLPTP